MRRRFIQRPTAGVQHSFPDGRDEAEADAPGREQRLERATIKMADDRALQRDADQARGREGDRDRGQQVPALRADIRKRGLTLARRNGDVRMNPSVEKLTKIYRALDVLAASLVCNVANTR